MGLFRNHFQLNSARSPVRSRLRPFSSTRSTHPSTILIGRSPWRPTIARDAGGRWSVAASPRPADVRVKPSGCSGHPPVTNVARNSRSFSPYWWSRNPSTLARWACGESAVGAAGCVAFGSGSMCRWRRSAVVRIPAFRAGDRDGRNAAKGSDGIRNAMSGATRRRPRRRARRRRQTWHHRWCPITELVQIVAGLSQAARDGARQRGSILDYRCR